MTPQEINDNALSMWVALELLLEDPELKPLKTDVLADATDGELIAFLLASAETELKEDELNEQLQYFLVALYRIASEQLARFPLKDRRKQLSAMFGKLLERKPLILEAFPDEDVEIFLDGMLEGRPELMDTSVISLGSYLVLEIAERAFDDFDTKEAILELGELMVAELASQA